MADTPPPPGWLSIVMVLHDLNRAARFARRMIVLKDGAVHTDGPPPAVMTPAMLAEVSAMEARVVADPETGTPFVMPTRHLPAARTARASEADARGPVPAMTTPC